MHYLYRHPVKRELSLIYGVFGNCLFYLIAASLGWSK